MKIADLISRLAKYDPQTNIMILDGFNGGGVPREINLGPTTRVISKEDADETADCEDIEGKTVVVLGFGCY